MEKKKVSRFEFAIKEAVERQYPNTMDIEKYEPYTAEEEMQQRIDNIKNQLENIFKRNPEA